jgi:hypothetical protein
VNAPPLAAYGFSDANLEYARRLIDLFVDTMNAGRRKAK